MKRDTDTWDMKQDSQTQGGGERDRCRGSDRDSTSE